MGNGVGVIYQLPLRSFCVLVRPESQGPSERRFSEILLPTDPGVRRFKELEEEIGAGASSKGLSIEWNMGVRQGGARNPGLLW